MSTATAAPISPTGAPATPCSECGEPVLHRYTAEQRPIVLDAVPVSDGVRRLDQRGRAVLRSLVLMSQELRAGIGEGYQTHECRGPREGLWYERD